MSSARATTIAIGFSNNIQLETYERSMTDKIVNREYQGEINGVGSKLNIYNLARIAEKDYTGVPMTADNLFENNSILVIEKKKSFYWAEKTLDDWLSYVKNVHNKATEQAAGERTRNMDIYVLGFYGDVAAGNRVGTDYTTGTVTVDVTTGVVTGAGTTFTASMVGRGFKAAGHTKWYRVKTYTNATSIVIEDDLDDVTSAYTGGAIAGGSTYTIEAATPIAITTSNFLQVFANAKLKLGQAERNNKSNVPDEGRWLVVPDEFETLLPRATGVALHVPEVYQNLVKVGMITTFQGFMVFKSGRLTGNNTDGWRMLGGHTNWLTFAEKVLQARIEEDIPGDFGTAYKDLFVYGGKVTDSRRHFAVEIYATFTLT